MVRRVLDAVRSGAESDAELVMAVQLNVRDVSST